MAKKKVKSRPRCICGAYADLIYMPSRKTQGLSPWVEATCRKCSRYAMDAKMVAGGCLKFIDDMEMEFQEYDASEEEAAAAVFTERSRHMNVDGENYMMAIFKIEYEHGPEWFAQPVPWEAVA
jgi:hypothetical protein